MYKLRDYQQAAIDALFAYWGAGNTGNPIAQLSTGAGKSIVIAELTRRVVSEFVGCRVLILSHVKEIIEQNHEKLSSLCPDLDIGCHSASLGVRDCDNDVLFGSVQTLCRRPALDNIGQFNMVIVDECHMINSDDDKSMYMKVFNHLRSLKPGLCIVGLTATPYRQNSGMLTDGDNALFDRVVYETDIQDLIDRGYLSDLVVELGSSEIDTTGVKMTGGDFNQGELEERALDDELCQEIADDIVERGKDRKGWLLFCVTVEHAKRMCELIEAHGISTAIITGNTPQNEREELLSAFKAKDIKCVVNVAVLTTGFDAPHVDLVAILRPTRSPVLYIQILGRGLRIEPNKENCLILDYAGCVGFHGAIDKFKPHKKSTKMVDCNCGCRFSSSHKYCPFCRKCRACDFVFGVKDKHCPDCKAKREEQEAQERAYKLRQEASRAEVLSRKERPIHVSSMRAILHVSKSGKECVCVEYWCGLKCIKHYVSPENPRAMFFFRRWFEAHAIDKNVKRPWLNVQLISMFQNGQIRQPDAIKVVKENGFEKYESAVFGEEVKVAHDPFSDLIF